MVSGVECRVWGGGCGCEILCGVVSLLDRLCGLGCGVYVVWGVECRL